MGLNKTKEGNTGKKLYSVVVPVYNTDQSLGELYERLETVFREVIQSPFELILVDDASPNQQTWSTIKGLHEKHSAVHACQLMQNSGQQNATMCGLHYTCGDRIIIMDDDLQHQPEEIPKLISALEDNSNLDVIIAVPEERKHTSYRNLGSFLFQKMMNIIIHKPKDVRYSSFILLEKYVRDALIRYQGNKITTCSLINMNTRNIQNVTVTNAERIYGESGYSFYKLFLLAMNHVLNFSSFPLKMMSVGGAIISILSICYASFILYEKVTGQIGVAGFATIVILLSLYSGMLMFSLGVIGQYMVRILRATTYGQQFAVRRIIGTLEDRTTSVQAGTEGVE